METAIIVALIGAASGSTVGAIVVACLQRKWAKQDIHDERVDALSERVDALVDASKVQMIDRVRWLGKNYIADGEIHLEDKENLIEMYNAYKKLGGNGHLETVMSEIKHLKVI